MNAISKAIRSLKLAVILGAILLTGHSFGASTVSLTASNASPAVGSSFTVTVNLSGAAPFANWAQFLQFDKSKLQLTAQGAGTFSTFVQDARTLATINTSGEIHAGGFGLSNNAGGSGTLGVFTFQTLAAGTTTITTQDQSATVPFGDQLSDTSGAIVLPGIAGPLSINIGGAVAPSITSALTAAGTVGSAFSYTITASNSPTSFNATGLPVGLSINTTSGVISGTPTVAGTSNATISATNSAGAGSATLVLTVNAVVIKPAVTSTLTATGTVGSAFSYVITASNSPTSFNATGLPAGLSINTTSGVISGTPTAAGTTNITISASNSAGTGSATLVLTVNAVSSPTITLTSSTSTPTVGNTFTVTVNLSGAAPFASWAQFLQFDNTRLQLTSQAAGSFSTFVQDARTLATINSTGEVHAGGFGLSNNAGGSGTLGVFTFTAIAAGATQITTQDKSATFAFGDVLSNASSVNVLPTIAGPLSLTIGSGVTKPAITSPLTATGTVGSAFSYTITASNSPTSFNATGLPAGLSINTTSGVISGTPTVAGTSNVTISASNSAGTGSATLVLTINAIASPTITLTSSTSTPTVGNTFTVTVNLSGAAPFASWAQFLQFDKTKVQLTAQATGTFNTFVQDARTLATINANGEVHAGGFGLSDNTGGSGTLGVFTFKAIAAGATQITTQDKSATFVFGDVLSDASSANVLPTIAGPLALTIGSNNHAPVIASGASATPNPAVVGQIVAFTVVASDPDGDTLSYAWSFGDGSSGSGTSPSHAYAAAGTYSATVTASDPGGLSVTSTVSVAVSTSSGGTSGNGGSGTGSGSASGGSGSGGTSSGGSGGSGGSGTSPMAMTVSKIQGSVNFKADGHDAVSISGVLPGVASPFTPAGTVLNLNVSGATTTFTLDAHGKSRIDSSSIAFKLKSVKHKKGSFNGGNLAFVAKLQHGTWSSLWNMNNNATNAPTPMSAIVQMNGNTYMTTVTVNYSGKANQGGKFKK